jgi:hypothetical protein
MTIVYEIPLKPSPQSLAVVFPSGVPYILRLIYQFNQDDCWILDIQDAQGNPILSGVPLITGADLLAQYAYLGFGCKLFCSTDGERGEPPHWWNLGITAHLWLE